MRTSGRGRRASPRASSATPNAAEWLGRYSIYAAALRQIAVVVAFAATPVVVTGYAIVTLAGDGLGLDFRLSFWPAGDRVLEGVTPYVEPTAPEVARATAFVYPAVGALLFVPFALLPAGLANGLFVALCLALAPAILALLGVRDWRLYGLLFLWQPVLAAWQIANVMLMLALGVALLWRYRDRAIVAGLLLALLVSVKIFVWPLAIWLLGSRRYAALGYAMVFGLVLNVIAWAVIGFDQIPRYLDLLSAVSAHEEGRSYSVLALALEAGASRAAAYTFALALAAGAGVACFVLARRARDEQALLLGIAAGLLASPIIWTHYFVLLIVPLALLRPRLSWLWALPVVMLLAPTGRPDTWELVLVLLAATALVGGALRPIRTAPGRAREDRDLRDIGPGKLTLRHSRP